MSRATVLAPFVSLTIALCGCGGGSSSPTVPGAAAYGRPASSADREEIARVTERFLAAEASGRWPVVCSLLATTIHDQLGDLRARLGGKRIEGCPATLAALFKQNPEQLQAVAAGVEVVDVRAEGSHGYVFYATPKTASAYLPLEREQGVWKVATISGSTAPRDEADNRAKQALSPP